MSKTVIEPRIIYDGIVYSLQKSGGISRYFSEVASRTAGARSAVMLDYGMSGNVFRPVECEGLRLRPMRRRMLERYRDANVPRADRNAIFHTSYYRSSSREMRQVVTVYDFIYERYVGGLRAFVHRRQKAAAIERASALICISDSARRDLQRFFPEIPRKETRVIHLGVDPTFRPSFATGVQSSLVPWPFALFVGSRDGYKNFTAAYHALAGGSHGLGLVAVGGEPMSDAKVSEYTTRMQGRFQWRPLVADGELVTLYQQASCLLYPSLYEGFGMPVIEAMSSGCPVIGVNASSIPEVTGDAALLVERGIAEEFSSAISILTNGSTRETLVARGLKRAREFSWERCAQQTMALYRDLAHDR